LSTLSKYLFSSISKVLLPIALIASVYSKKWFYSLSVIFVAIILTGVSSHKSVIFLIILALTVYFLSQNNLFKNHVVIFLLIGIIFLSLLDLYVLRFFYPGETPLFGSLILRRGLFASPMNDQAYLVFFQSHDWIYWSDSKITLGLFEYPYTRPLPLEIGYAKQGIEGYSANTGIVGSGFANLGLTGFLIYSFILSLITNYVNKAYKFLPHTILFAMYLPIFLTALLSSDLITTFITHGLLFFIILSLLKIKSF
jgi:hypothetical protein